MILIFGDLVFFLYINIFIKFTNFYGNDKKILSKTLEESKHDPLLRMWLDESSILEPE